MDLEEWIQYGVDKGWSSAPVCVTHEGLPTTDEEDVFWSEGMDPCEVAVRIWPSF